MTIVQLSEEEWRKRLTPDQYEILRQKGTEPPFSGALLHNKDLGNYTCAACKTPLFSSETKFDSGSGWPSFYDVLSQGTVKLVNDDTLGVHRVEVQCGTCGSHLGHVFDDAYDQPTGQRYCINSASLSFSASENNKNKQ